MPAIDGPSHLAIGEVLTLLKLDFPDVTISKIRFLESQGLIDPERTASGYRKFYEDDIRRLQWVLRQQKERYMPLKVIKAKLDAGEDHSDGLQPTLFGDAEPPPPLVGSGATESAGVGRAEGATGATGATVDTPHDVATSDVVTGAEPREVPEVGSSEVPTRHPAAARVAPRSPDRPSGSDSAAWLAALQEGPNRPPTPRRVESLMDLAGDSSGDTFSEAEVAEAAKLPSELLAALVDFGLVGSRVVGGERRFDSAAVEVARAAAVFIDKGIEVRHLRGYKLAAEREVALFEQLTLPLLRLRNPASRQQAANELASLTEAGAALRIALLRQALGPLVKPR